MSLRFRIYSGKTLEDLLEQLNNHPDYCGRIVFMEHTSDGYTAVLDEWALTIIDINSLDDDEDETREFNRNILLNANLDTSNTL